MIKKILFISHDDSRTGAPILLINLKRAINKVNPNLKIDFLIKNSGKTILNLFQEEGETYILNESNKASIWLRLLNKIGVLEKSTLLENKIQKLNLNSYDIILSNTITNGDILPFIKKEYKGKIISYIHELQMASSSYTNKTSINQLINSTDLFVFPSNAVKTYLINEYGIEDDKLMFLPYFIDLAKPIDKSQLKDGNDFVVGACGTPDWRKGFDIFISLALFTIESNPKSRIKFIWKGVLIGKELERAEYDIKMAGLSNHVVLKKSGDDMIDFWASIDLFVLTSREDPFPLVVLEAASYKIPTIAFDKSGGAPEFIEEDAGFTVPYLSIQNMSKSICLLYENNDLFRKLQLRAFEKVSASHSNLISISTCFHAILTKIYDEKT